MSSLPASELDEVLTKEVLLFAQRLNDLLEGVLEGDFQPFSVEALIGSVDTRVVLRQQPPEGIPILVDGKCLLRVEVQYKCAWDSAHTYLAIRESEFKVMLDGCSEPLYRYDFISDGDGKVPGAHLNVHAHRDEMVHAMVMASKHRGRSRNTAISKGRVTRLARYHFPVGGHRFRPSLEDVLEGVIREFGADTKSGWEMSLATARAVWRETQLKAAVRDFPAAAAAMLRDMGYLVEAPEGGDPTVRDNRRLAW